MFKYFLITFILIALNYKVNVNKFNPHINKLLNFSAEKNLEFQYNVFLKDELDKANEMFARLKSQLNIQKTIKLNYEVAEVLYFDNHNNNLIFVINKGSNHGIKNNQGVITIIDNQPVTAGRIIETEQTTSKVLTIYSPDFYISAKTINDKVSHNFILSGGYNKMFVKYFPYKYDFIFDDIIYTTGNDGIFLANHKIGKITEIVLKEPEPDVIITPFVDYMNIEWVIVLN
jgi:rod shape-determining protein MreC